jgi:ComF family protein
MFSAAFERILDLFCPAVCPVCGSVSESGNLICSACEEKMVTPQNAFCLRCGAKRLDSAADQPNCLRCRNTAFRFRRATALGNYAAELRSLVLQMKKDKNGISATAVAQLLVKHRRNELTAAGADLIVPVPMSKQRYRMRGVNSPDFLAAEIARLLKIPAALTLVKRIRHTGVQYPLSYSDRQENVTDAFAMRQPEVFRPGILPRGWFRLLPQVSGRNILLVDDILTTASTCNEVSKTLLTAGVKSVTVAVIARAGIAPEEGEW